MNSVGKTSLMHRYVKNIYTGQYKATIGADFLPKTITIPTATATMQKITLQIWDTAGQERFQSLGNSFYRGADVCVLVYDVFDRSSFDGLMKWKNDFMRISGGGGGSSGGGGSGLSRNTLGSYNMHTATNSSNSSNNDNFPFVVMGNKADKEGSTNEERQVSKEEAFQWCQSIGNIPYFETSAKTALNIEPAFEQVAKMGYDRAEKQRRMTSASSYRAPINLTPYGAPVDLNRPNQNNNGDDCC